MVSLVVAAVLPAQADQTDPRLDHLFEVLAATESEAEAQAVDREIWNRWLASNNQETDLTMVRGILAMQLGHLAKAKALFSEIIARHPNFAEAWNKRATVRYLEGDLVGSISDCESTLALEARHYGALSGLGLIHLALGDKKTALMWFEQAVALNPHMEGLSEHIESLRKELKGQPTRRISAVKL
jgi:tetratricopeptide (TPR) repeat protein